MYSDKYSLKATRDNSQYLIETEMVTFSVSGTFISAKKCLFIIHFGRNTNYLLKTADESYIIK